MNYKILLYAMSSYFEWAKQGVANTNRQIVKALVKHDHINQVVMVDFLPFNFKRKVREYLYAKIYKRDKETILKGWNYKVNQYHKKLIVISTISKRVIPKILTQLDFNPDIAWSFNPIDTQFLQIESRYKFFTAIDNWEDHPIHKSRKALISKNYNKIADQADHIFTVAAELQSRFKGKAEVTWLPNAVDWNHFQVSDTAQQQWLEEQGNELFKGVSRPILGYLGVMQDRLDWDTIEYLLQEFPDYSVAMAGPIWPSVQADIDRLKSKYKNFYIIGAGNYVNYAVIPNYMKMFDIAIMPHQTDGLTKSMNPMKLYEYCAVGKPVISSPVVGTDVFKKAIYIANNKQEWGESVKRALNTPRAFYSSQMILTKANSWPSRIKAILAKIK